MTKHGSFDFIIVGAGSAGCVLANRLSADPSNRVLLIEAGGRDTSLFIHMPAGYLQLMRTGQVDWGYSSSPQKNLYGRRIHIPRGKVVGGSSSVNGMVYIRGDRSDFDHWGQLGNAGWMFDDCLPYFLKSEGYSGNPIAGRGTDGLLRTSRNAVTHELTSAFFNAAVQYGLPYNEDFNSGGPQDGVGPVDVTVADGRRYSSARAYLRPVLRRRNLTLIVNALVSKVLVENEAAVGVEYVRNGRLERAHCDGEVILAGGAVNSPQILQLSGIGHADDLSAAGIKAVHDLPGVGKNLQDHPTFAIKQRLKKPISMYPSATFIRSALSVARYLLTRSGPAAGNGLEAIAFARTRPEVVAPDLQFFLVGLMYEDSGRRIIPEHGFMLYHSLQRPDSRGSVSLQSSDPTAAPNIDLNYFDCRTDLAAMRDGVKVSRSILAQPAFDPYRGRELDPGQDVLTDADIDASLKRGVFSGYHLSGTCKMGTDPLAVVDNRLRVRGIRALRVADASIMPTVVSGNTNAAVIMIGEKASDILLGKAVPC